MADTESETGTEIAARCRLCRSVLPAADALICPVCGKAQTKTQEWIERNSFLTSSLKLLVSALLIPGLLWLVAAWYDKREEERNAAATKYAEIVASLPRINSAHTLLYEPCVGTTSDSCAASVDAALTEYLRAEKEFGEVIARYFPELQPSVVLLASLDREISLEVADLWQTYFVCVEEYEEVLGCVDERRRKPIESLQTAQFIIYYLRCEASLSLAQAGIDSARYCQAVVEARKEIVRDRPTEVMAKYDGKRMPEEIRGIRDEIWSNYIAPGSGLQSANETEEPQPNPPPAANH